MERRDFLRLLGVTGAGTLTACDAKVGPQSLIPYLVPQEDITPGVPTWYASTCRECPAGCGVHVKTREGRVIKLEGNPENPVNRGKLCARGQSAHQNLYDPDRLKGPQRLDGRRYLDVGWEDAVRMLAERIGAEREEPGSVVFLTGLQTGTRARLYREWADVVGADWVMFEPFAHEAILEANRRVFGEAVLPSYDIEAAELVISFGADFLETWVSPVRYARQWSRMHAVKGLEAEDGRRPPGIMISVEPRLSMTAANADEWIAPRPGTEFLIALAMANVLGAGGEAAEWPPARAATATGVPVETIERLAALFGERRSLALPGGVATAHSRATEANVAVNLLNQAGGAVGDTLRLTTPVTGAVENSYRSVVDLTTRLKTGRVRAILFSETNPVFTLPPGLGFAEALRQVPFRVSFSPVFDETAAHCHLLLPDHTPLESWGDWVPEAGVLSIVQPAMRPVFNTRSTPDVLLQAFRGMGAARAGEVRTAEGEAPGGEAPDVAAPAVAPAATLDAASWPEYLRAAWADRAPDEHAWAEVLRSGGVWQGGPAGMVAAGAAPGVATEAPLDFAPAEFDGPADAESYVLHVYPQIAMYDGRTANRAWLQELPDPSTTACWQTWVEIHPETARALGIADGDVVAVESSHGRVEAPVIAYPGVRPDSVAMPLGRGHTRMGRYAGGRGVNPVELLPPTSERHSGAFVYQSVRVRLTPTGAWLPPLKHQGEDRQHDRGIAQAVSALALAEAANGHAEHEAAAPGAAPHEPMTVERAIRDADADSPYRWGMAISVDACTGCQACVAACAAENNLPFVGPERVAKSRQMTWLRIERFFEEKAGGGIETRHVPMLCQHCGAAPCEPVCPVYATYHNPEGLNVQVYNRCVGTRYCSNNCPYKVRYFNWFTYEWPEPLNWGLNPDVTVREKGVMEKCTYCIQRINAAKIAVTGDDPDAVIPDGAFQTACQQTCPTDAIVFGNLKDPGSRAARLARGPLAYSALDVLNTRPANFYLKQVNQRVEAAAEATR
ncbi:MAG TPA: molybdopterin dinucleotide binding domain-containing protein [Gemmatimonadota bacterium]|nr:molybdopterin dinucleotide binding domain-containing protein [Gemmatimonadota bacterium]